MTGARARWQEPGRGGRSGFVASRGPTADPDFRAARRRVAAGPRLNAPGHRPYTAATVRPETGSHLRAALLAVVLSGIGCSSDEADRVADTRASRDAAAPDAAFPPEARHLSLVVWPIYDTDDVLAATEDALPSSLEGVEVCLEKARQSWGALTDR
jgi:hypothetical protein